jgi:hypothetical protein
VRSREAGWEFVRVLEDGGDFYDVGPPAPRTEETAEDATGEATEETLEDDDGPPPAREARE